MKFYLVTWKLTVADIGEIPKDGIGNPIVYFKNVVTKNNSVYAPHSETKVWGNALVTSSSDAASMYAGFDVRSVNGKIELAPIVLGSTAGSATTFYFGVYSNNIDYYFIGY